MEEKHRLGISTKYQSPSGPDTTTNHGTSRALEKPEICKSGAPTQDGSKCSNLQMECL
jgi:hypothetical protein